MNRKVSETIFSGKDHIIPMAEVQHIEKITDSEIWVITSKTKWNFDHDMWENPIHLIDYESELNGYKITEKSDFIKAYCYYRYEKDTRGAEIK